MDYDAFKQGLAERLTKAIDMIERGMAHHGTPVSRRRVIAFVWRHWLKKMAIDRAKDPARLSEDEWQHRLAIFAEVMQELERKASN